MNFINSIAKNSNFAFFNFSANFWWIFFRISRQIPENSDVCRFFNQICENKSEICRKFWTLWKKFTIIQNYSLHSLVRVVAPIATGTSSRVVLWVGRAIILRDLDGMRIFEDVHERKGPRGWLGHLRPVQSPHPRNFTLQNHSKSTTVHNSTR